MKYSIQFQYMGKGDSRPEDCGQDEELNFEDEYPPIPDVGDSVSYQYDEKTVCRKVLTRHFSYIKTNASQYVFVNIVVTDIDDDEMSRRIKE